MISLRQRAALIVCAVAAAGFAGSAVAQPAHKARAPMAAGPYDSRSADAQPYPMAGSQQAASSSARASAPVRASGRRKRAGDAFGGYTSNSIVAEARKYLGTNPTGRSSLWCGAFMDLVLKRTGYQGAGNLARAYTKVGRRISSPQVGAIAVLTRRGGGHVGVVSGIDPNGNPIIVSGNHNRTVAESVYPASRVTAYVLPES